MGDTKSDGKEVKTTTATSPADGTSKNGPTQTTDAAVGGGGMGTANPDEKKEDAKDDEKGDPVAVAKGAVTENVLDLALPGLVPFQWRRRYSSTDFGKTTPLGRGGWTHDHHQWIEPEGDGFLLRNFDGVDLSFGPIPAQGGTLHRGRQLFLQRKGDRFDVLDLASRWTRSYAPSRQGGRAWLRSIADCRGNRIAFHYEGEALVRVTDTAGREIHLQLDAKGRIVALDVEVDKRVHRVFTYGYTDAGELAFAADGLGQPIRYAYDGKHRVVQKWLRNGFSIRYEYDPVHGRVARTRGDEGYHQVEFTYDFDKRTTTTHGEPQPRVYYWDAHGNVVREETFDGRHVIERTWDRDRLLVSEKNAAGEEHRYEHDARGFLIKATDPAGNITRHEYVDDLLRRVILPNGNVRAYDYDGYGALWGLTLETGARYSVDRDGKGRIVALYGPGSLLERYEYDAHHNLAKATSARGAVTSYDYDDLGHPTTRRDPLGRTTRLEYDVGGRVIAVTHADGTRIDLEHDSLGKVTRIQRPGGDIRMEYVATGALARTVMEDGGEWRISYDREEKPVQIENPKGERYELRYDRAGRVVEERTFDGRVIRYSYNASGRLHRIERPDETWREFVYDTLGNLVEDTSPHGPITFERDSQGRLLKATLEEGPVVSTVTFERDHFGRVVAETQDGKTFRYEYDAESRVTARILPTGEVTRFRYDLDGELAEVEHGGQAVRIARDAAGQELLRHFAESPTAVASSYDAMGRLASQEAVPPQPEGAASIAALLRRRWEYDAVGRPLRIEDARWGTTEYSYDRTHNLVRAQRGRLDEEFEYDPAGALVRTFQGFASRGERWSMRQGDVLVRTEKAAYEIDTCGRRTRKVELANGKPTERVTEYVWDCRDRLREVRTPGGEVVRYFYDAFGRRTRKIVFPLRPAEPGAPAPPPRVVRFLWDGDVLAAELDTGRGARAFVHEPGTFRPILQIEQGEVFLYVLDQVGTPRELLDVQGRVAWAAAYRAWGRVAEVQPDPMAARARAVESPFRLLGQYADDETGLHWTRFRYWDPDVGRWCSPDPLGIEGGARLFAFDGSPTLLVDPFGLDTRPAHGAAQLDTRPAHGAAQFAKLKDALRTAEAANPLIESLRTTGKLPSNYLTKAQAAAAGWQAGKPVGTHIPGGQIGGDVFQNTTGVLPSAPGRTWYEADVGLSSTISRSKQPGTRLLYSSDGLLYVTADHYETVHLIGTWK
ncbi:RHS repeat-associated core domain-containing protein [Sorangium sp. So ce1153]|uniref:RHS repeat-associated core domain-containing protein n=1 Tax=Sorangium sp. So ce1153 TaxID=3133333 RepID=UPI003F610086